MAGIFVSMGFSGPAALLFTAVIFGVIIVNDGTPKQKKSAYKAPQIGPKDTKAGASNPSQSLPPHNMHSVPVLQDFGEYREPLKSGGYLTVSAGQWSIQYFLHGPGGRFDRTIFDIPGKDINTFCRALRSNFIEYCKYRSSIPSTSSLVKQGEMGMKIRINTGLDGVFLYGDDMCIDTENQLSEIISDLKTRYCAQKRFNICLEIQTAHKNCGKNL
ncbi:MAG TPA: hypothetical protein VN446_03780 [Candidatus Acidoferrum sp.]|nr:hypothetical protein [Candidatus Acidoferrum sp.]